MFRCSGRERSTGRQSDFDLVNESVRFLCLLGANKQSIDGEIWRR